MSLRTTQTESKQRRYAREKAGSSWYGPWAAGGAHWLVQVPGSGLDPAKCVVHMGCNTGPAQMCGHGPRGRLGPAQAPRPAEVWWSTMDCDVWCGLPATHGSDGRDPSRALILWPVRVHDHTVGVDCSHDLMPPMFGWSNESNAILWKSNDRRNDAIRQLMLQPVEIEWLGSDPPLIRTMGS